MAKYGHEAKEKAYELWYIQRLPFTKVIARMREEYPTLAYNTLTKWSKDRRLAWDIRYDEYCRTLERQADKKRVKEMVPIVTAIEEIREKVYNQLVSCLEKNADVVTEKNIGLVLASFVRLGELEYRMKGKSSDTPYKKVINVLILALEKNPNIGPLIKAHKNEIVDAIIEEIKTK